MKCRYSVILLACGLSLLWTSTVSAEARISPQVQLLVSRHNLAQTHGHIAVQSPFFGVLLLKQELEPSLRHDLQSLGVGFHEVEGRILKRGRLLPARIPVGAVAILAKHPAIAKIEAYP